MHLPATSAMVPPNAMMIFKGLLPVVCFDVLNGPWMGWINGIWKVTEEETAPFPGQMEELGYESTNFIDTMGTIFYVMLYIVLKAVVLFIIHMC